MLYTFRKFLNHYAGATLVDVLHSPFVFGLYNKCFKTNSTIQPLHFSPLSKGYFNRRTETIIKKIALQFPEHHFTLDIHTLPADKPFILLVEDPVSVETLQQKLHLTHNDSMVILKNMYANPGSSKNWEQLKHIQNITVSIDLFFMGLLFVRKEQLKQEFRLRMF